MTAAPSRGPSLYWVRDSTHVLEHRVDLDEWFAARMPTVAVCGTRMNPSEAVPADPVWGTRCSACGEVSP